MDGEGLIESWLRFLWGLVRGSIAISLSGSVGEFFAGVILLSLAGAIVFIPLLLLTLIHLGKKLFAGDRA